MLTNDQWNTIKNLLKKDDLSDYHKKQIHHLLYTKYENIAYWKAYQFKKLHNYKCSHLSVMELSLYSKMGLYKAIQKYNPQYSFYGFISLYIHNELCKGLTDLYPICSVPKSERIRKKKFITENNNPTEKKALWENRNSYKKKLRTKFIGKEDWLIDKNTIQKESCLQSKIIEREMYEKIWIKIHRFTYMEKYIFQLKYDFYFNKIRSNLEIAENIGYSEEYVRRQVKSVIKQLLL